MNGLFSGYSNEAYQPISIRQNLSRLHPRFRAELDSLTRPEG
jgi:hypothetical protein